MVILKPYGIDFSHPALKNCFSIKLVKRLKEIKEVYEEFLDLVDEFFNVFDVETYNYRNDMLTYINDNLSHAKKMFNRNWEDFFQHYGLERRCENCGEILRADSPINKAHIIKRPFFKKQGTKIYRDVNFEHHMTNTLILCANCHDRIEKKGIKPNKRLIERRIKIRDRILSNLETDIYFLKEKIREIKKFRSELVSYKNELEEELQQKIAEKIENWVNYFCNLQHWY